MVMNGSQTWFFFFRNPLESAVNSVESVVDLASLSPMGSLAHRRRSTVGGGRMSHDRMLASISKAHLEVVTRLQAVHQNFVLDDEFSRMYPRQIISVAYTVNELLKVFFFFFFFFGYISKPGIHVFVLSMLSFFKNHDHHGLYG